MTITREIIKFRRNADYAPNTITVDNYTAWYLRFHYRNLRRSGASAFAARTAIYDLLFQASLRTSRPVFTAG